MNSNIEILFTKDVDWDNFRYWTIAAAENTEVFNTFWKIAQTEKTNAWRALWIIERTIRLNQKLLDNILVNLYELMLKSEDMGYLRIGLKLICKRKIIDDNMASELLNKCEKIAINPKAAIATRANCLQFIFNFCKSEIDLINELNVILDTISEQNLSYGMKSKVKNIRMGITSLRR